MNDDIEELLARLTPKGLEAGLRPRVLGAVASELTPREKTPACNHPAGHQFICVHCGRKLQPASLVRRLSWPGALAAMTSIAATLLVVMLINRPALVADREGTSQATSRAGATGPSASRPVAREAIDDRGIRRRLTFSGRPDARGILSAGDTELDEGLPNRNGWRANDKAVSMIDMESADSKIQNGTLRQRLLRESGKSLGGPDESIFQPSDLQGSKL